MEIPTSLLYEQITTNVGNREEKIGTNQWSLTQHLFSVYDSVSSFEIFINVILIPKRQVIVPNNFCTFQTLYISSLKEVPL